MYGYLLIGLILIAISIYLIFFRKQTKPPTHDKPCTVYFFYTAWCPVCKRVRPEWEKFKAEWHDKSAHGHHLEFKEVDCDLHESLANQYDITKYPTVKLVNGDSVYDFDAKVELASLTQFIHTVL